LVSQFSPAPPFAFSFSLSLFFRESIPLLALFLGASLSLSPARVPALSLQGDDRLQNRRWREDIAKREGESERGERREKTGEGTGLSGWKNREAVCPDNIEVRYKLGAEGRKGA